MKKTLITAICLTLGFAATASAASTRYSYDDAGVNTTFVTDTSVTSVLTASDSLALSRNTAEHWTESTTTFTLAMDKLATLSLGVDEVKALVTINVASGGTTNSIGMGVKNIDGTNKFVLLWNGVQYTNTNWSTTSWVIEGSTGTYSLISEASGSGNVSCTYFADSGKPELWLGSGGLGSSSVYTVTSVSVDSDYVTAFAVTDATLDMVNLQDGVGAAAVALHEKVAESVPEPATATLSLLALAGLAARRRRK